MNADTDIANDFHRRTNHSPESVRRSARTLDWDNQPRPFKIYSTLQAVGLPTELPGSPGSGLLDISTLATLLHFSNGVTRWIRRPGWQMPFRAAACTGALYHIDLYVVSADLPGLGAGVYHFAPEVHGLRQLRAGDWRGVLIEATAGHPAVVSAPVSLIATTTYWRNAWKYTERAYRHAFWDSGTILANTLSLAVAYGVHAEIVTGFVDLTVNRLLDLDTDQEVALQIIPLGRNATAAPAVETEMRSLQLPIEPYSPSQIDYPLIRTMHGASSLVSDTEVERWRAARSSVGAAGNADARADVGIESVIQRRGSARRFSRTPISLSALTGILESAAEPYQADFSPPLTAAYVIANAVNDLAPGTYRFADGRLDPLRVGETRLIGGHLALDQALAADAAANIVFMADLRQVLHSLGNRGYRAAQLDGGIRGGKAYLAAYARGLGATGLTFYDEEVTALFSPSALGMSPMFWIAIGERAPLRGPR